MKWGVSPVWCEMDSYTASSGHFAVPESSFDLKLRVWEYCSCVSREVFFCVYYGVFYQHICQVEYIVYAFLQSWKRFPFSNIQSLFFLCQPIYIDTAKVILK